MIAQIVMTVAPAGPMARNTASANGAVECRSCSLGMIPVIEVAMAMLAMTFENQ
jgi:hypothetical protein